MAKKYIYDIDRQLAGDLLPAIRNRIELAVVLLKILKYLTIASELKIENSTGKLIINVSKMSRLFVCLENKTFSISLPFTIIEDKGAIYAQSTSLGLIDNTIISFALNLLEKSNLIGSDNIVELADELMDETRYKPGFWQFIQELLMAEDGYIRFDSDSENENGHLHPLEHIDVFYTNKATFKLGSNNKINSDEFIDVLDIETDCYYISNATT